MGTSLVTLWRSLFGQSRNPQSNNEARFSPAEIREYMRKRPESSRERTASQAVGRVLAHLDSDMRRNFKGSDRIFRQLTLIVIRYSQGKALEEIAEEFGPFCYAEDIEIAIDYVATLAAQQLNRRV